jgi:hypothetical protein
MTEHGRGRWILLRDERGQQLELNWYPPGSEFDRPFSPGEGLGHIGFEVPDVFRSYADLVATGPRPTAVTPWSTEGWQATSRTRTATGSSYARGEWIGRGGSGAKRFKRT